MLRMGLSYSSFTFVASLVAVINALGIVRLLSSFAEYLRQRRKLEVQHFWVYYVQTTFQLLIHVLLWWSVVGLRDVDDMNFLNYLYLLIGPTLLFLGTSLLLPNLDGNSLDLRSEYLAFRKDYFTVISAFWLWVLFVWPVFVGAFAPTAKLLVAYLVVAVLQRISANLKLHGALVIVNCLLFVTIVGLYAMQLGAVGRAMSQG